VLLRASGTEPVIRVMVETFDPAAAESAVDRLCAAVEDSLGRPGG
jgi:phosphomannomutase